MKDAKEICAVENCPHGREEGYQCGFECGDYEPVQYHKKWVLFTGGEECECGSSVEIHTTLRDNQAYDGDAARCTECLRLGSVSCDGESFYFLWDDEDDWEEVIKISNLAKDERVLEYIYGCISRFAKVSKRPVTFTGEETAGQLEYMAGRLHKILDYKRLNKGVSDEIQTVQGQKR